MSKAKRALQVGFSLIEMMVVVAILTVVLGIIMKELVKLQQLNMDQNARVDLSQQARQFVDQISLDIHQSGYPSARLFSQTAALAFADSPCPGVDITVTPCAKVANGMAVGGSGNPAFPVVNGLEYVSPTQIQFEGDIDGSGQVSEVFIQLIVPAGGNCSIANPCTLRRAIMPKAAAMANNLPTYYTELTGVMNNAIFSARDSGGNTIILPATDPNILGNIRSIDITVQVQAQISNIPNQAPPLITVSSGAKVNSVLN